MIVCQWCKTQNSNELTLCSKCGNFLRRSETPITQDGLAADLISGSVSPKTSPPSIDLLVPPKAFVITRPWIKDWVFWVPVVLATIGGSQSLYREGSASFVPATGATYLAGLINILFLLPLSFLIAGGIPALIRWPFRKRAFNKTLRTPPNDPAEGWKRDPFLLSSERWWTGTFWSQATKPNIDTKIGALSFAVIGGVFVIMVVSFLTGISNRGVSDEPDLANVNIEELMDQLDLPDAAELADRMVELMLDQAFEDVNKDLQSYFEVQVNPDNVIAGFIRLASKTEKLDQSQKELERWLGPDVTQDDIGGLNAPSLESIREFSEALRAFIVARQSYYADLEKCEPLNSPGRVYGDCDLNAFDAAESDLEATDDALRLTYQAVLDSRPKN